MAFTTDWMWRIIDRRKDYSVTSGVETFRENWTLARYLISNDTYVSELGDTASSLSAENGGVTETVGVPTGYSYYQFSNDADYPYTPLVPFYSAGYNRNGRQAYIYSEPSPEDSSKSAVIFYEQWLVGGSTYYYWHFTQCTNAEAQAGTFPDAATADTAGDLLAYTTSSGTTPVSSLYRVPVSGDTFPLVAATSTLTFRCTSDAQSYDQPFVDWFTQTQTWVVKSPWA